MWTSISSWQFFDQRDDQHAEAERPCRRIGIAYRKVFARRSKNLPWKALDSSEGLWVSVKFLPNRKVLALYGKFNDCLGRFSTVGKFQQCLESFKIYAVRPEFFCALRKTDLSNGLGLRWSFLFIFICLSQNMISFLTLFAPGGAYMPPPWHIFAQSWDLSRPSRPAVM